MQNRRLVYALLLILAAGVLSLAACGNRPGGIKGRVTDSQGGQALAQVRLVVYPLTKVEGSGQTAVYQKGDALEEQVTDEGGNFSFSLAPGAYIVRAWMNDQQVGDRMVKVTAGRAAVVNFQIEPPSP